MNMTDILLKMCFGAYVAAAMCVVFSHRMPKIGFNLAGPILMLAGFLFHTAMIVVRWHEAGRPPFASMYEALVLFSWSVVFVYFIFDRLYRCVVLFAPALTLSLILLAVAFFGSSAIKPLVPALQSPWMSVHVIAYFTGYGSMSLAFMLGIVYVVSARGQRQDHGQLRAMDGLIYRLIIFGFPFLTIGMTTGSAWAQAAWGTYWGWDPKETCSLITWLVYAAYLHLRLLLGWKDMRAAWMCILGFLATLFTFIGVNYILPGLHSYTS